MTKPPHATYEVGYGKPPRHTQFKPGQSGNPNGRPKGSPPADELFLKEAARLMKIESGGKIETISRIEVVVRQLFKTAAHGDLRAINLVLATFTRLSVSEGDASGNAPDDAVVDPSMPDDEVIQRMLQRFTHHLPKLATSDAAE